MNTKKAGDILLDCPGQGLQHSGSAVLHSGSGSGPASSDEQMLQKCKLQYSPIQGIPKTTARLQSGEVKDGNVQKSQRRQKDRKRESSFSLLLW